jgi:hypothetical protein
MVAELALLQSPAAVQTARDEFALVGRTAFLARYGYCKSRDFMVRDAQSGHLCDSKAIVGAAYGYQFPRKIHSSPETFPAAIPALPMRDRQAAFCCHSPCPTEFMARRRVSA